MSEPTLAACTTPPGTAALAVIELRGPEAWSIARAFFRPRGKDAALPEAPQADQFWLGRFGAEPAEDVVLSLRRTDPTPWLSFTCHGGREVVRLLLETLETQGVLICSWQELERNTAENSLHAQARTALAEALTPRTAAILLDQLNGAFARAVDEILATLQRGELDAAATRLTELNRHAAVGRHLTKSWRVTIGGAPNVGKSSLLNAIAGYERCIVSPTPGTTRDVVTAIVALDGWPMELADTAGLRHGAEPVEAAGIAYASAALADADVRLWLLDASTTLVWPPADIGHVKLVINKIDLPAAWDLASAPAAQQVSALTGAGIADLCTALARQLVPDPPAAGSAVPFTEELCGSVTNALQHLATGDVSATVSALQSCLTSD